MSRENLLNNMRLGFRKSRIIWTARWPRVSYPGPTPSLDSEATNQPKRTYLWGGKFHPVPEGFRLPRPTVKAFFTLWHQGDQHQELVPLKQLDPSRDLQEKTDRVTFSKSKQLMESIESLSSVPEGTKFGDLTNVALSEAFDDGFMRLIEQVENSLGRRIHRPGDLLCSTTYKLVKEASKAGNNLHNE